MITRIALATLLLGFTATFAHAAPATPNPASASAGQLAPTSIAPDWGVKRQTVGFRHRGFRRGHGLRRGGFGFRRGYRGYRSYRRAPRFGYRRGYSRFGYGYRGYYGRSPVSGLGTVR